MLVTNPLSIGNSCRPSLPFSLGRRLMVITRNKGNQTCRLSPTGTPRVDVRGTSFDVTLTAVIGPRRETFPVINVGVLQLISPSRPMKVRSHIRCLVCNHFPLLY